MHHVREGTDIYPVFSKDEAAHILLPRENVVVSYVRELEGNVLYYTKLSRQAKSRISSPFIYCHLQSSEMRNTKHWTWVIHSWHFCYLPDAPLQAAYAFYSAAESVSLTTLMNDALIVARDKWESFPTWNPAEKWTSSTRWILWTMTSLFVNSNSVEVTDLFGFISTIIYALR